jgi:hypothetical protein
VVGRRGGKSKAMATLAAYLSGLCEHDLVRGEKGVCLCIAPDQRQAGIVLDYATAAFEASPILRQLISMAIWMVLDCTFSCWLPGARRISGMKCGFSSRGSV